MSFIAALQLAKTFGPWIALALLLATFGALVVDRNHLAKLNDAHQACLRSVNDASGAKPLDVACDAPIAKAAEAADAAAACDHALSGADAFAASQACSGPVKALIADRDAKADEAATCSSQLAQSAADRDAAVARGAARATAASQGLTHAQSVIAGAPRDRSGSIVCDVGCLRALAQPGA